MQPEASGIFSDPAAYERATARYSRQFARQFVPWMAARRDARWLDAGCGTGALTQAIIDLAWPGEVVGIDTSDAYLEHARRTVPGARLERAPITELPFEPGYFDGVVSGLVLHHLPDPDAALREMCRVTAPGGQVGVYVWDRSARQNGAYWRAVEAVGAPPSAAADAHTNLGSAADLTALLGRARLGSLQTTRLEATVEYASFDEWWNAMMDRRGVLQRHYESLEADWQARVRERARVETGGGAGFSETAAAWAARGRR